MTLPNFIVGGAPKSGTTALWNYLHEHPDVFLSPNKEPRFFTRGQGVLEKGSIGNGPARTGLYSHGLTWYAQLFRGHNGERAVGEASVQYFAADDSPELIRRHIPDVRLIFVLRDPVDRIYSNYWQDRKLGWPFPSFLDMVRTDHPRLQFYADVSSYRKHLTRFSEAFGREQLLVLLTEELRSDPRGVLRRVCNFLQVDNTFTPDSFGRRYNSQRLPRIPRLQRMIMRVQCTRFVRNLPHPARAVLRRGREALMRWNSLPNDYAPLPESARRELVGRFRDDVLFVQEWTGHDLRGWLDPVSASASLA